MIQELHLVDFNPRSREGSDAFKIDLICDNKISIHAPAKGATGFKELDTSLVMDFNPRSREGSD